jgi:lambda repressor-like predicted transcriptional regulator
MKRKKAGKNQREGHKRIARRKRGNALPFKKPNTARQYFLLSPKNQETWDSIGHVISKIREEGISLPKAAKQFGLSPRTVITLGGSALKKQKNGRYVAKKTDRLLRVINVLKTKGRKEIATRDSRQASLVGGHWAAVQRYLQTGDDSALQRFKNKKITDANGKRHLLLTDLDELDRLGRVGVLRFESMYAGGTR